MVKISELSDKDRQQMVNDISFVMGFTYKLDMATIKNFWDTIEIGIEVKRRV